MTHKVRSLIAIAATAPAYMVMAAAPAQADESEYLEKLVPKYVYLSPEQLLNEGYRVCRAVDSGLGSGDAIDMVRRDLSVNMAPAYDIATTAITALEC